MDASALRRTRLLVTILPAFLSGVVAAALIAQALTSWISLAGSSAPARVAFAILVVGAVAVRLTLARSISRMQSRTTAIVFGAIILCASWLLSPSIDVLLSFGARKFTQNSFSSQVMAFIPASLVCGIVVLLSLCWFAQDEHELSSQRVSKCWGLAAGCLVPLITVVWTVPLAVFVTVVVVFSLLLRLSAAGDMITEISKTAGSDASEIDKARLDWLTIGSSIGTGICLVAVWQFVTLMMPGHLVLFLFAASLTLLVFGAAHIAFIGKVVRSGTSIVICLAILSLLPVVFDNLVSFNLRLTANTASLSQLSGRAIQIAVPWLAAILIWRTTTARRQSSSRRSELTSWLSLMIGMLLAEFLSINGVTAFAITVTGVVLTGIAVVAQSIFDTSSRPAQSWKRWGATAVACMLVTFCAISSPDTPAASRLLFNAQSFQNLRSGIAEALIDQSDSARLLETHNEAEGLVTVWRTSGNLLEVRRNGIPTGMVTESDVIVPQPIAEVAPAFLGLTTQPNAQRVLITGDDLGANLRVCCGFPVTELTAVRPHSSMNLLAKEYSWSDMWMPPTEDDRVEFIERPETVAVRALPDNQYDVFIASGTSPLDPNNLPSLTADFYEQAVRVLTDDGVLCQRIQQHDLGAESLIRTLSTLCQNFSRVAMMQVIPGEIIVFGTNSEQPLLDRRFMNRLQRDHVQQQLSRSGWDWSQLAGLAVIDVQDPVGIFKHEKLRTPSNAANNYFAMAIPLDAQRWGDKRQELRDAFSPHQMRVAEATPIGPAHEEFRRRISAVAQQTEILSHFPDQPWPYRSSLRSEMQRNPRPPIKEIRDGKMHRRSHPLDEYRKDYFIALGNVLQEASNGQVSEDALQKLTNFTQRYEPLLSYFAHHELVRIHELSGHPSPEDEWKHRLHTVFYHQPGDYSVRHVTAAIEYLLEHESVVPDESQRFDYLNAMLQELVKRWEFRRSYEPKSATVAQNDVDQSVQIANDALDHMLELSDSVSMNRESFIARRKFINTVLVSPLRDYRQAIVAHRAKNTSAPATADTDSASGDKPLLIDPSDLLTN